LLQLLPSKVHLLILLAPLMLQGLIIQYLVISSILPSSDLLATFTYASRDPLKGCAHLR
jgi:hypothetical protein